MHNNHPRLTKQTWPLTDTKNKRKQKKNNNKQRHAKFLLFNYVRNWLLTQQTTKTTTIVKKGHLSCFFLFTSMFYCYDLTIFHIKLSKVCCTSIKLTTNDNTDNTNHTPLNKAQNRINSILILMQCEFIIAIRGCLYK